MYYKVFFGSEHISDLELGIEKSCNVTKKKWEWGGGNLKVIKIKNARAKSDLKVHVAWFSFLQRRRLNSIELTWFTKASEFLLVGCRVGNWD